MELCLSIKYGQLLFNLRFLNDNRSSFLSRSLIWTYIANETMIPETLNIDRPTPFIASLITQHI